MCGLSCDFGVIVDCLNDVWRSTRADVEAVVVVPYTGEPVPGPLSVDRDE